MTTPQAITLEVNASTPYRVHIGTFLLEAAGSLVRNVCSGTKALIVTDSQVGPLYVQPVQASLERAGFTVAIHTFEAGEEHKRLHTLEAILEDCAATQLTRSDVIVALGGGVTGDMAGFAAATYMRGIAYVQMPTTLLAMVDSSVGGKTAVDLAAGKNLAGAFWQPSLVIADVGCLATLTPERFADGCGEVVKHAMIADKELFAQLEQTPLTYQLLLDDVARTCELIAHNVAIKKAVVASDERESGARKLLNFGHSIGHGIEAASSYRLGHGTCVAMGMVAMTRAAARTGACDSETLDRLEALLHAHGLETTCSFEAADVFREALHDKKRNGDTIDIVLPRALGSCSIQTVDLNTFKELITWGLSSPHIE